ncbi:hypothetical protein MXB_4937, partial [Myxobolus squamalis]
SIEADSLKKSKFLTKTIAKPDKNFKAIFQNIEIMMDSFRINYHKHEFKHKFGSSVLLDTLQHTINQQKTKIITNPLYKCNFYREKRFLLMQFNPEVVISIPKSAEFFKLKIGEQPRSNRYYDLFDEIKSHVCIVNPSKLVDRAGYELAREKSSKKNRHYDYLGAAPIISHPHFIVVKSPMREKDMYQNNYCPISHGMKVGFGALTAHLLELNRSRGKGTGWGYAFGKELSSPLCCHV